MCFDVMMEHFTWCIICNLVNESDCIWIGNFLIDFFALFLHKLKWSHFSVMIAIDWVMPSNLQSFLSHRSAAMFLNASDLCEQSRSPHMGSILSILFSLGQQPSKSVLWSLFLSIKDNVQVLFLCCGLSHWQWVQHVGMCKRHKMVHLFLAFAFADFQWNASVWQIWTRHTLSAATKILANNTSENTCLFEIWLKAAAQYKAAQWKNVQCHVGKVQFERWKFSKSMQVQHFAKVGITKLIEPALEWQHWKWTSEFNFECRLDFNSLLQQAILADCLCPPVKFFIKGIYFVQMQNANSHKTKLLLQHEKRSKK